MHPGTNKARRRHESRAAAPMSFVATPGGIVEAPLKDPRPPPHSPSATHPSFSRGSGPQSSGTPPRDSTADGTHHAHTARAGAAPLAAVKPPRTGRTVGTRIGDPAPSSVGAFGGRTASDASLVRSPVVPTRGTDAAPPAALVAANASPRHGDPNAPSGPHMAPSASSQVVPASASSKLPPIERPRRGRLHAYDSAEAWIDGIIARYGGLALADDPAAAPADESGQDDEQQPPALEGNPLLMIEGPHAESADTQLSILSNPADAAIVASKPRQPYTTVSGAQLRKQIFALCQQLIVDATRHDRKQQLAISGNLKSPRAAQDASDAPVIEVEVRERGVRVWHSAGCSEAELDDTDVAVEAVDEDVAAVRKRAQKAYRQTVRVFKERIDELRRELEHWKAEAAARDEEGSLYRKVQAELDAQRTVNKQLNAKIKALMKLLERAGATIKHQEEQHEHDAMAAAKGGSHSGLDWEPLRGVIPDLIVEEREVPGILRDVVEYVDRLNLRVEELESSNEMFSEKYASKDEQCDTLRRENDSLVLKMKLTEGTMDSVRADAAASKREADALRAELTEARKYFESERDRLIVQTMEAEKAIRKTVESKASFVALGRGLSVPVFLRFEGRVRNLDMPKKDVEDLINLIWAARDTHNAVKRAQKAIEHREKQARGEFKADDAAANVVVNLGAGNTIEQLIDYDNIRFVKRPAGPFNEHVAVFLIEHFGNAAKDQQAQGADGDDMERSKHNIVVPKKGKKDEKNKLPIPSKTQMRRYGFTMPPSVVEYAYSLMEGCEKFKYDADVELFRRVARQEISEYAYFDQMIMLAKLKVALLSAARANGSANSATIKQIIEVIRRFFPTKPAESVELLQKALVVEIPDGQNMSEIALASIRLSIPKLFASNEHGNQGSFMEAVRDQHLEEVCLYVSEISDCIAGCSSLPEAKGKMVPLYAVRRRLHELDPLKPMEDINRFLLNALAAYNEDGEDDDEGPKSNAIHLNSEVDCERLSVASKKVFAKRYGPRNHDIGAAAAEVGEGAKDASRNSGRDSGAASAIGSRPGSDVVGVPSQGATPAIADLQRPDGSGNTEASGS